MKCHFCDIISLFEHEVVSFRSQVYDVASDAHLILGLAREYVDKKIKKGELEKCYIDCAVDVEDFSVQDLELYKDEKFTKPLDIDEFNKCILKNNINKYVEKRIFELADMVQKIYDGEAEEKDLENCFHKYDAKPKKTVQEEDEMTK